MVCLFIRGETKLQSPVHYKSPSFRHRASETTPHLVTMDSTVESKEMNAYEQDNMEDDEENTHTLAKSGADYGALINHQGIYKDVDGRGNTEDTGKTVSLTSNDSSDEKHEYFLQQKFVNSTNVMDQPSSYQYETNTLNEDHHQPDRAENRGTELSSTLIQPFQEDEICGMKKKYYGTKSDKKEKVIILLGATGSGKTTLVNFIANYFQGNKKADDELGHVAWCSNDDHSLTKTITAYTFCDHQDHTPITVIDTPGLDDSSGAEIRDHVLSIKTFLANITSHDYEIHAIGFVAQAHLVRLTTSERLVMDYVSTLFGEASGGHILTFITFGDSQSNPPVVEAMAYYGVKCKHFFKFNNSVLTMKTGDEIDVLDQVYWNMGNKSWKKCMKVLKEMPPLSVHTMKTLQNSVFVSQVYDSVKKNLKSELKAFINTTNIHKGLMHADAINVCESVWQLAIVVNYYSNKQSNKTPFVETLLHYTQEIQQPLSGLMSPKHSHSDHCTGHHHKEDPGQGAGHPRREPGHGGGHNHHNHNHNHQQHRGQGWRGESPSSHHRSRHGTRSGEQQQQQQSNNHNHNHNHHRLREELQQQQQHRRSADDPITSRHTAVAADTRHGSRHSAETTRNSRPTTDSRPHGNRTTSSEMENHNHNHNHNNNNRRSRAEMGHNNRHTTDTRTHNNRTQQHHDNRTRPPTTTPSITETVYSDCTGVTTEYYAVRSRSWESEVGRGGRRRTEHQGRSRRRSLSPSRTDRVLRRHRPLTETSSTSSTRPILDQTQREEDEDDDDDEELEGEGKIKCSLGRKICKMAKLLSGFLISMGLVMVFYVIISTIMGQETPIDIFDFEVNPEDGQIPDGDFFDPTGDNNNNNNLYPTGDNNNNNNNNFYPTGDVLNPTGDNLYPTVDVFNPSGDLFGPSGEVLNPGVIDFSSPTGGDILRPAPGDTWRPFGDISGPPGDVWRPVENILRPTREMYMPTEDIVRPTSAGDARGDDAFSGNYLAPNGTSAPTAILESDSHLFENPGQRNVEKDAEGRSYIAYIPVPLNNEEEDEDEDEDEEEDKDVIKRNGQPSSSDPYFVPVMIVPGGGGGGGGPHPPPMPLPARPLPPRSRPFPLPPRPPPVPPPFSRRPPPPPLPINRQILNPLPHSSLPRLTPQQQHPSNLPPRTHPSNLPPRSHPSNLPSSGPILTVNRNGGMRDGNSQFSNGFAGNNGFPNGNGFMNNGGRIYSNNEYGNNGKQQQPPVNAGASLWKSLFDIMNRPIGGAAGGSQSGGGGDWSQQQLQHQQHPPARISHPNNVPSNPPPLPPRPPPQTPLSRRAGPSLPKVGGIIGGDPPLALRSRPVLRPRLRASSRMSGPLPKPLVRHPSLQLPRYRRPPPIPPPVGMPIVPRRRPIRPVPTVQNPPKDFQYPKNSASIQDIIGYMNHMDNQWRDGGGGGGTGWRDGGGGGNEWREEGRANLNLPPGFHVGNQNHIIGANPFGGGGGNYVKNGGNYFSGENNGGGNFGGGGGGGGGGGNFGGGGGGGGGNFGGNSGGNYVNSGSISSSSNFGGNGGGGGINGEGFNSYGGGGTRVMESGGGGVSLYPGGGGGGGGGSGGGGGLSLYPGGGGGGGGGLSLYPGGSGEGGGGGGSGGSGGGGSGVRSTSKSRPFKIMLDVYPMEVDHPRSFRSDINIPDNNNYYNNNNRLNNHNNNNYGTSSSNNNYHHNNHNHGYNNNNHQYNSQGRLDEDDANKHEVVLHLNLYSKQPLSRMGSLDVGATGRNGAVSLEVPLSGLISPLQLYQAIVHQARTQHQPQAQGQVMTGMEGKADEGWDATETRNNKTTRDKAEIELFEVEEGPLLLDAIDRGLRRLRDQLPNHLKFDIVNESMTVDELHEAVNGKNAGVGGGGGDPGAEDMTGNRRPPASPPYQQGDKENYDYYDYYYYDYYSEDGKEGEKNETENRRGGTSGPTDRTHPSEGIPSNPTNSTTTSSSGDYYYSYDDNYYYNYYPEENGKGGISENGNREENTTTTLSASTTAEPLPTPCWHNTTEVSIPP
ncbi:hypothetical protein Pcinc_033474 [Petrolisthes cinctipes]|uniref:AIG1-type G domain-containing protein n=1 Tax=Petrolisthes cinctipes TaxID=88211 RepID=A0AAE1K1C0_PETCI|nr:hypothetical protein Pcinc_033474 [Petrolisthes cinctipes]